MRLRPHLPGWVWERALKASGHLRHPIDVTPLETLATVPPEHVTDSAYVEKHVLPAMGISDQGAELFPPELAPRLGTGVQHNQFPVQFAPYLAEIARRGTSSYLEIGVEYGGTFAITVELLRRLQRVRAVAVDLGPTPLVLRHWHRPDTEFVAIDSQTEDFRRRLASWGPFDLVFIDGDHAEAAVRQDIKNARPYARMIAVHDITEPNFPAVGRVWREFRAQAASEYEFREFIDYYGSEPRFGIGLAIRR
jgi:predicted O-methyltransferase YrrM